MCVMFCVCGFASHGASQTSCVIATERFDSFSGPADFDDGPFKARWCLNGASVASSSFCPGGNALRLDATADDPVLWVFTGGPATGCTHVTIEFDYSQFQNTATFLRYVVANDTIKNCQRSISQTAGALTAAVGVCTRASHTVALGSGQSVYWKIDHGANANAIFIDNVVLRVSGCCGGGASHGCCETGEAGCENNNTQSCVCAIDPFCCQVQWDEICVDEVESLNCGSCAPVQECIAGFVADFGTFYQTGGVCARFPQLFERCEGNGPYLTTSTACGGSGDAAMSFATGFPYSAAVTHCIDLSTATSARLEFNYTKNTGTLGPRVDISADGATFSTLWTAPVAFADGCRRAVIDLAAYAGLPGVRLRFASGSSVANGASVDDIALAINDTLNHECCDTGPAGCLDANVSACVCAIDPFCCEVEWDDLCVLSVEYYQCGDCGFCVESFDATFGGAFVGGSVCDVFPDLFILCDGAGPWLTTGTACGAAAPGIDPAMIFISGTQTSAATTRCLNLANVQAASVEFAYSTNQNGIAPVLDISLDAGGTFSPLWRAPADAGSGCRDACADLSPYASHPFVLLRFAAAGPNQGGSAIDDIHLNRGAGCPAPPPAEEMPGDIDGSGAVDVFDLFELLAQWGTCSKEPAPSCSADLAKDGVVDVFDLFILLGAWTN